MNTGVCAVCRREGRGFAFHPVLARLPGPVRPACSMTCLHIIAMRKAMIDPTPNEQAAIRHGGSMGGEYLESIRLTDLASLSEPQWLTFVEAIVTGYCDRLRELAGQDQGRLARTADEVPF